ncbi:hypothetical protein EC121427_04960 [Escherichia coli O145:H28]|uniref:Uncharacterized protein n=1 Tax=Escherichia coli TaxID=562 RepID=Q5K5V9_ECOLX|nr:hypothetical protein [Escherichia coli]GEE18953.1 hypothetical protein EC142179_01894 [Escherichia coli O145:H28]CAR48017.1 hypothetical protein [Escherichia coli]CTS91828.1 Uncharacterised protein [Escherichia coli]CTU11574.1 Uncharacterised protein [Escherichia coli]
MKPVQIGFHLCDTAGDFFGTTAEVHPAEFIQLRLQMVYFALPVAQLFLQGVDQRFLFGQALFQQEDVVSVNDGKWLFRNLGGDFHASGLITLCLSSSNPARPYIWRFSIFRRFT